MRVPAVGIDAVGMACPIGLTAASACAAMRAGVDRWQDLDYRDDDGEAILGSRIPELPEGTSRRKRCIGLLARALRDVQLGAPSVELARTAIFLRLPCERGGDLASTLARELSAELGTTLDPGAIHLAEDGVDALRLLDEARNHLHDAGTRACLVCAADSLVDARSLLALARDRRLKTPHNADGVIPGEAAACVRLVRQDNRAPVRVRGIGSATEPGLLTNDVPLRGEGLAAAARSALDEAGLAMHDLDFRLSDAAGEAYHFKEQTLVLARLLRQNMKAFPLWLAAQTLGHVGQAAGLCNLVWATVALTRGYAPGPRAIVFAGDDGGRRSAVVVEREGGS